MTDYRSRDWALDLWDLGYQPVIAPLKGKQPSIPWKRWQTERVPREQVQEWFKHGEHNIALLTGATGGVVVVDGDSKDACSVIESTCTTTPMVVKTSKGAHYYYRHPGGRVPNAVRLIHEPPVDLRGDGGLVIGPGSMHNSGIHYQLAEGSDLTCVQDLPIFDRSWFPMDAAEPTVYRRPVVRFVPPAAQDAFSQAQRYMLNVPGAIEGSGGDHHTYVQACRLVRGFNLSDEDALTILLEWNAKCDPAWDEKDLADKVRHARAYGTGEFGAMLMRGENIKSGLLCFGWPA